MTPETGASAVQNARFVHLFLLTDHQRRWLEIVRAQPSRANVLIMTPRRTGATTFLAGLVCGEIRRRIDIGPTNEDPATVVVVVQSEEDRDVFAYNLCQLVRECFATSLEALEHAQLSSRDRVVVYTRLLATFVEVFSATRIGADHRLDRDSLVLVDQLPVTEINFLEFLARGSEASIVAIATPGSRWPDLIEQAGPSVAPLRETAQALLEDARLQQLTTEISTISLGEECVLPMDDTP